MKLYVLKTKEGRDISYYPSKKRVDSYAKRWKNKGYYVMEVKRTAQLEKYLN